MELLELMHELDLHPKRVATTNGGEYHSSCPQCGGKDRFIIWNAKGRYYCRRCEAHGDVIQFCRDFLKLSFKRACFKVGKKPSQFHRKGKQPLLRSVLPKKADDPCELWQNKALEFLDFSHKCLLRNKTALGFIHERGFTFETILNFKLGWNPTTKFESQTNWGLNKTEARDAKLWLPEGFVIPSFRSGLLQKIKIRRAKWHELDKLPKYVEISGSSKSLSWYCKQAELANFPIIIVESELDAILIQQEASELCACLALGGATKKPDFYSHQQLCKAPKILFSLDFDEAGKKSYIFWKNTYKNLKPWPAPNAKSPGDAFKTGIDLRKWIKFFFS